MTIQYNMNFGIGKGDNIVCTFNFDHYQQWTAQKNDKSYLNMTFLIIIDLQNKFIFTNVSRYSVRPTAGDYIYNILFKLCNTSPCSKCESHT